MTRGAWTDDRLSWGRVPRAHQFAVTLEGRSPSFSSLPDGLSVLPQGLARSYGDSCVNDGNALLLTERLKCFIGWDASTGLLRAEAGVSLHDVLRFVVPQRWFLPVTPGTQHVTLGGAVANDVHGKNHHRAGSFGKHVTRFELWRSDGSRTVCSREQHSDLFRATIGGLGLTGLITWIEIQLMRVPSADIDVETIRFSTLDEFLEIDASSAADYEYTVAWLDALDPRGRGHYMRGRHAAAPTTETRSPSRSIALPVDFPERTLNDWTIRVFNALYYRRALRRHSTTRTDYRPFFYPLDAVRQWNRLYGRRGFYQYQCVVPLESDAKTMRAICGAIARSNLTPCLTVLKSFGDHAPEGLLSFPRAGLTLAVDFPNRGADTLSLLERLDGVVRDAGGAVYPAKDGRMSRETFAASFPRWREFSAWIDPRFSSTFWRRVAA